MKKEHKTILAVILALAAFFAIGNTVTIPSTAMITKVIQEAYTVQEPYQVAVDKDLSYRVTNYYSEGGFDGFNYVTYGKVNIENQDTTSGTFVVNCNFKTLYKTLTDSDRIFINPGESKTATCKGDTSLGENVIFSYSITPGTKTVFETRYKDVTKYRDKKVQEPQTVYKTLFQTWGLVQ